MDDTDDTGALVPIGVFARRVGLAPSALRFYDDCGVLRPAHVDEVTGYRYYSPDQEPRAVLVRRLREAGLPLVDASVVLDGRPEAARAVLTEHARRTRDRAAAAQAVIEDVLRALPGGQPRSVVRVGGAELSSAVRQVASAVAPADVRARFPVLGCVLLELDGQELRLVATDRYRLAVRVLRPLSVEGAPHEALVDVDAMRDLAAWSLRLPEVSVEVDGGAVVVRGDDEVRPLPTAEGNFPSYRLILDALPTARTRVVVDREALRGAVATAGENGPATLDIAEDRVTVSGRGAPAVAERAILTGRPVRISFDPGVLLPALDASVGPDVLLEISSATEPVVVRSADQGSFTTLVMPVRRPDEDD
ncbi:DNA polymerase III beta subunit, C-terminal domain [Streptoalloteichus tenebrarius]|uniref:DNA polymerase III beta subunit, C-terminal domain n=1 Tax=Streptoalloteichus tenebrarius (strain ATCC 17920 / DSM 40477 / JCM 4838 / CBS 697.72 / NBRC 16177 / NCIMB 11028 / NRRL B-12390 / A12253. 1 / ISP 5477) TaxID=1933 RepID=A0ABT1I0W6_STRSD|nr:MerR family transcriptional regulator [Streptoalloteichus tenebrarius]MCP2261414.1 DNA polymerase III beta subunit, C-terminal domain [Streptoalloteichus tenebrarius]BFF02018.1 MerR family transcriptional regulator [Streptoalloteichus tenebrarius]